MILASVVLTILVNLVLWVTWAGRVWSLVGGHTTRERRRSKETDDLVVRCRLRNAEPASRDVARIGVVYAGRWPVAALRPLRMTAAAPGRLVPDEPSGNSHCLGRCGEAWRRVGVPAPVILTGSTIPSQDGSLRDRRRSWRAFTVALREDGIPRYRR